MTAARTRLDVGGIRRPQGQLDASTALRPYDGPLDRRLAAHLLRRAGFGATPEEIDRYASMSPGAAVESLVHFPSTASLPAPTNVFSAVPALAPYGPRGFRALPAEQKRQLVVSIRHAAYASARELQLWWLNRMLATPAPLQEKMTLLFHGHYTSAVLKKQTSPAMAYNQNQLFRRYALGNLRELTRKVSVDPAMVIYLDNADNSKEHPNENYARELMELFTLGIEHYTENDVRESARAWTGWQYDRFTEKVAFDRRRHDDGSKTFLGRTGNFNGDDIVNIIFEQPQCARFFAGWLLNNLVYNDPEPELVDGVANLLRHHDYELAPVVATLLRSRLFFSPRAYRALIKSPVEFVVGTYKTLGLPQVGQIAIPALREMGQELFSPPNVAGWPGGQNWLTSDTLIARQNFLSRTINSQTVARSSWLHAQRMDPQALAFALIGATVQGDAAADGIAQVQEYLAGSGTSALAALSPENYDERVVGAAYLAMAMPAYQLG